MVITKKKSWSSKLVIALFLTLILVGLFIFFQSVTGNNSLPGSPCVSGPGYVISNCTYSHITGNLTIIFAQNRDSLWTSWAIAYAPQGSPLSNMTEVAKVPFSMMPNAKTLSSGQNVKVILPVSSPNTPIGTPTEGIIYACYTTTTGVNRNVWRCRNLCCIWQCQCNHTVY